MANLDCVDEWMRTAERPGKRRPWWSQRPTTVRAILLEALALAVVLLPVSLFLVEDNRLAVFWPLFFAVARAVVNFALARRSRYCK